jgi:hypothetical protein
MINQMSIKVFPNPSNGLIFINYQSSFNFFVEFSDLLGSVIFRHDLSASRSNSQIYNDKLQNGVYLYRIVTESGSQLKTGKIVVLK